MSKGFKKGYIPWNKGISLSVEHRTKIKNAHLANKSLRSVLGKLGAKKRWDGHIKNCKKSVYKYKYVSYADKYKNGLEKKRFTNMRYKARKRNAQGSHSFKEWLLLKSRYKNMCLCCKKMEPEIKLTEDHIIPLSMGGSDFIENIQPLCQACNTRKHAKALTYLPIRNNSMLMALPN